MNTDREAWEHVLLCALVFVLVMLLYSCGGARFATSPSEQWVASIVMGECGKIGVAARVQFEPRNTSLDGTPYGYPGQTLLGAMASRKPNTVLVYPVALDLPDEKLTAYARHECCHLALGHTWTPGRTEEAAAEACVRERY